jgi:hypothetical protein
MDTKVWRLHMTCSATICKVLHIRPKIKRNKPREIICYFFVRTYYKLIYFYSEGFEEIIVILISSAALRMSHVLLALKPNREM